MLQEELQRYFCPANDGADAVSQRMGGRPAAHARSVEIFLDTMKRMTNILRFRRWIADDNDADHAFIGPDLISATYVPRYLPGISMETRKTWRG